MASARSGTLPGAHGQRQFAEDLGYARRGSGSSCRFRGIRHARPGRAWSSRRSNARGCVATRMKAMRLCHVRPKRPVSFSPRSTNERLVGLLAAATSTSPSRPRARSPRRCRFDPGPGGRLDELLPGAAAINPSRTSSFTASLTPMPLASRGPSGLPTSEARRRSEDAGRSAGWWHRAAVRRTAARSAAPHPAGITEAADNTCRSSPTFRTGVVAERSGRQAAG